MKATGEVMAIGRNIEESLLKACRSLEVGVDHNELPALRQVSDDELMRRLSRRKTTGFSISQRLFAVVTVLMKLLN